MRFSLESDIEKLKIELRSSRTREQDLRRQLNDLLTSDKSSKNELQQYRQQNEQLQTKYDLNFDAVFEFLHFILNRLGFKIWFEHANKINKRSQLWKNAFAKNKN